MSRSRSRPEIDFYISAIDGAPVLHIDTPEGWEENELGPMFRVYINDDTDNPIWDNVEAKRPYTNGGR